MQVNVFGSLNTFIMTVLVDLYQLMGAAMLVCTESQLWDKQHISVPVWLSGRALRQQRKRLWVRFPGNTHTNEKCIT